MAMVLTAAAIEMTTAQVVVHEGGYNDALVVPSALTVDGKARITIGSRSSEISIYNKNFEKEASITPVSQSYRSGSITQEATVTVTGAKLIGEPFLLSSVYYWVNPETNISEPISATSLEEGLEKLKTINPSSNYKIYNIGEYSFIYELNSYSSYYENAIFGTQYPKTGVFYVHKDGYLCVYNASTMLSGTLPYELLYNESSAVWTTTADNTVTAVKAASVAGCRHVNADAYSQIAHSDNDEQLVCTQSFFNDDEEWEYVQYTYGDYESISTPTIKNVNPDGTVTLSRTNEVGYEKTGIRVLNQNGNVVLSMSFPTPIDGSGELDLWTINGKSYIQMNRRVDSKAITEFYEIEKGSSNVRKVLEHETEAKAEPDNTIYDLSGRVLSEKPATGIYIQGGKKYYAQ